MNPRALAATVVDRLGQQPPSLDAVETILAIIAPGLPGWRFGSVLNHLPTQWQPSLHADADRLVAQQTRRRSV